MKKRLLSLLLTLSMVVGIIPGFAVNVFAEESTDTGTDYYSVFVGTDRHEDTEGLQDTVSTAESHVKNTYSEETISATVHGVIWPTTQTAGK